MKEPTILDTLVIIVLFIIVFKIIYKILGNFTESKILKCLGAITYWGILIAYPPFTIIVSILIAVIVCIRFCVKYAQQSKHDKNVRMISNELNAIMPVIGAGTSEEIECYLHQYRHLRISEYSSKHLNVSVPNHELVNCITHLLDNLATQKLVEKIVVRGDGETKVILYKWNGIIEATCFQSIQIDLD